MGNIVIFYLYFVDIEKCAFNYCQSSFIFLKVGKRVGDRQGLLVTMFLPVLVIVMTIGALRESR
jgi:hypothetical protein